MEEHIRPAAARLASIHPQAHDVPMDMIVTEQRIVLYRVRGRTLARGPLELWSMAQGWRRARVAT